MMLKNQGFEYGVQHFYSPRSGLLFEIISEVCHLSKEDAQFLIELGSVYLNGSRCIKNIDIENQSYLRVHTKPRRFQIDLNLQRDLLFENENFVVIHKPSAAPSHASVDNRLENVHAHLEKALSQKLFVTTRLDVPTEGVLLYAKNQNFLREFNFIVSEKKMQKHYEAGVNSEAFKKFNLHQQWPQKLIHYMEVSPRAPKVVREKKLHDSDQICELSLLEHSTTNELTVLKIDLQTGRTHQIRAQLASLGIPILNDFLYGGEKIEARERIFLTATEMRFQTNSGTSYEFKTTRRW